MSTMACPACGGTFRAGFTRCASCDVDLIAESDLAAVRARTASPREALKGKKTTAIVEGALPACREIERALLDAGIPAYTGAQNEEGEVMAAGTLKVGVIIDEEDLQRAGAVLRARFTSLVDKEGLGQVVAEAVNLESDSVTCPACGHQGALVDNACADCGLFLGVPA